MKHNKTMSVNFLCCVISAVALVIAAITKSSISFSDFFSGNWKIDIQAVKEITFNISMGIIASAILTIFIEWRNRRSTEERNVEVKKVVMNKCAVLVRLTLNELNSGTDRDLLSVTHNFHHLDELVVKRLVKIKAYCEYYIENYSSFFTTEEIKLLNDTILTCQCIEDLTKGSYKQLMLSYDALLSRYYSSKKYDDLPLNPDNDKDRLIINNREILDGIVSTNEKTVKPFLELLIKMERKMPYMFEIG